MTNEEMLAKRKAEMARHNPWDRWTEEERQTHLAMGGGRPIKWTMDISLVNTVDDRGYVYVFAGGPLEGAANAAPLRRADGEVDGRSKGVRKCGRCGEHGHNARTCRGTPKPVEAAPVATPSGVAPPPKVEAPKAPVAPVEPRPAARGDAPTPRPMTERRPEMRASMAVPGKKVCSKCNTPGHNARTCGRVVTAMASAARSAAPAPVGKTGRLNTCGKCGGKGHNARTCKG